MRSSDLRREPIQQDLRLHLDRWKWFTDRLSVIARLVGKNWSRQRLLATCFTGFPHCHHTHLYYGTHHFVYEERWGETLKIVEEILVLGPSLRAAWSAHAFTFGDAAQGAADDRLESVNVRLCDEAIRDRMFWGYLRMIRSVARSIEACMAWVEACPCHHRAGGQMSRHRRMAALKNRTGFEVCPMATRRAAEMADGQLTVVLRRSISTGLIGLLLEGDIVALSDAQRSVLIRDFNNARRHLRWTFQIKLGHWQQLPWILCGLSHHSSDIARQCGRRALQLYRTAPRDVRGHPLVRQLCSRTSPLSQELQLFVDGDSELSAYPLLVPPVAKLKFITICKRWVEGQHAESKIHLRGAKRHGAVHLAFLSIQRPLRSLLADEPAEFSKLAKCVAEVRNVRLALSKVSK